MILKILNNDASLYMYVKGINSLEKRLWFNWCFTKRSEISYSFLKTQSRCFLQDILKSYESFKDVTKVNMPRK